MTPSASTFRESRNVWSESRCADRRFDAVDATLLEQRQFTEFGYARLDAKMDGGFARSERVERKLDQFIDVQLQTNQLVERRLDALEHQRGSLGSP